MDHLERNLDVLSLTEVERGNQTGIITDLQFPSTDKSRPPVCTSSDRKQSNELNPRPREDLMQNHNVVDSMPTQAHSSSASL